MQKNISSLVFFLITQKGVEFVFALAVGAANTAVIVLTLKHGINLLLIK
jgi:hypothetical protein